MHTEYLIGIDSNQGNGKIHYCQVDGYPMIMRSKDMAKLAMEKKQEQSKYRICILSRVVGDWEEDESI